MTTKTNIYKPRYKITYQTKNKIWTYKNSRLRGFFLLRNTRPLRRGRFCRYFMVQSNMKWKETRRHFFRPLSQRSVWGGKPAKRTYKSSFYSKQQLRSFYAYLIEDRLRRLFQNHKSSVSSMGTSFYSILESQIDTTLFRMRVLPTIFAANQLVRVAGVEVNNKQSNNPRLVLKPGDVVSFPVDQWIALYDEILYRVYFRIWGLFIFGRRQHRFLRKALGFSAKRNRSWKKLTVMRRKFIVFLAEIGRCFSALARLKKLAKLHKNELILSKIIGLQIKLWKFRKTFHYNRRQTLAFFRKHYHIILKLHKVLFSCYEYFSNFRKETRMLELEFFASSTKSSTLIIAYETALQSSFDSVQSNLSNLMTKVSTQRLRKLSRVTRRYKIIPLITAMFPLARRRRRAKKRNRFARLRIVHWYVPPYLHFEPTTLQAVLLIIPTQEQVQYAFACSMRKISSFYRIRGL